MSESEANFILNKAKNVDDALASARLFNEVQDKICRLQPFEAPVGQVYLGDVEESPPFIILNSPFIRKAPNLSALFDYHLSLFTLLAGHFTNKGENANFLPSKSPRSLSFNSGITKSAINESVINGAANGEPRVFRTNRSISL